ncbi:MAG: nucleoside-diphosphate kinase [Thermodesulfobacteriota bacterium]
MERTLVFLKPDALQRGIIGEIISRFERKGLKIVSVKMMRLSDQILDIHYSHLSDRPFFEEVKQYMKSGPIIVLCLEGLDCVDIVRTLCGITNSRRAAPGSIRGDFGMSIQYNLLHASDSKEAAEREISLFFRSDELFNYDKINFNYLYSTYEQK